MGLKCDGRGTRDRFMLWNGHVWNNTGWMVGMAYSSAHSLIPDVGQRALDFVFNCNGFLR